MAKLAQKTVAAPVVLVLLALLACKGSDKSAPTSASASASADPAAAAPTGTADVAAETMGTFVCKEIEGDACVGPTNRFPVDAPIVHVSYRTKSIPKEGEVFTMQWIAEDVGETAKPNTVVATVENTVGELPDFGVKSYAVKTQLSKPTAGWPQGKYRVEIKLSGTLVSTARFEVAAD